MSLTIPEIVKNDPRSVELLRVWAAEGGQCVTLVPDIWKDPAAWGIMLVDLATHISRAYSETGAMSSADALARIREGFDAEWAVSTDFEK